MSKGSSHNSQSGFTILEIIISLFMVGVMLIMYQTSANTIVLNRGSRYREIAVRIANNELQSLRQTTFTSLPSSGPVNDPLLSSLPGGSATRTMTVINDRAKQARVEVLWNNPSRSGNQQVIIDTAITQGGLGQ